MSDKTESAMEWNIRWTQLVDMKTVCERETGAQQKSSNQRQPTDSLFKTWNWDFQFSICKLDTEIDNLLLHYRIETEKRINFPRDGYNCFGDPIYRIENETPKSRKTKILDWPKDSVTVTLSRAILQ